MSIRSRLIWLVFAVLAPTLVFGLVAIYTVYHSQWKRVSQSMQETTRAVALAVERDLHRYEAIVSTVAIRPSLVRGDLETFYRDAQEILQPFDAGVTVFDLDGIPLLDTHRPFGAPLPMPLSLPSVINAPRLDISPLFLDPYDGNYAFAIHRPVIRDGTVIFYISMEFPIADLGSILYEQGLPEEWLGVVLDQQYNIVARTRDTAEHVGQRANMSIRSSLLAQPVGDGITESVTRDGQPVLTFFSRVRTADWTVLIAIPNQHLFMSAAKPLGIIIAGIALALALALTLAFAVGRTITRPLALLDSAAEALGRGEVIEPLATGIDETDRTAQVLAAASRRLHRANVEMSEQVAQAISQAERSHQAMLQGQKLEALGRLTGGIAHDFNNLLQSMTVGLELTAMLSTHPRAKRALDACQRAVDRGTRLTRQLMTFSRNRTDEAKLIEMRSLIIGMSDLLAGAMPSRVELFFELPERSWPTVADPLQCELAILNLALNARDAMPDGGTLTIGLAEADKVLDSANEGQSGRYLELRLTDTGMGMSEEVKAKAFEPFFTTKAVGEGTGLGLAQVYGFAHQSGGSVSIASAVNHGTCVSVWLPLSDRDHPQGTDEEARSVSMVTGARVLVVDDDDEVRDVVASLLEQLGYAVDVAADAASALERFESIDAPAIDLLFSDIVMPGSMDGVGLAQAVRDRYPDVLIVLATGYTERVPDEHGFRVLAKPFDIGVLAGVLIEALQGKRHARLAPL